MPEMKLGPVRTKAGSLVRLSATVEFQEGRIVFVKSPYNLKGEIKSMRGSRWHQFDEDGPLAGMKIWTVDDCQRNRFQLGYLAGEDVYAWFDRPLVRHQYRDYFRNGAPTKPMPVAWCQSTRTSSPPLPLQLKAPPSLPGWKKAKRLPRTSSMGRRTSKPLP